MSEMPAYAEKAEQRPAVCVGETRGEAYCRWAGGRLPTLNEWLVAARGEEPKRFSWGDLPTSCEQHPLAPRLLQRAGYNLTGAPSGDREEVPQEGLLPDPGLDRTRLPSGWDKTRGVRSPLLDPPGGAPVAPPQLNLACETKRFDGSELVVGTHPAGASPSGMQDVLLTPGELLKADDQSPFNACSPPFSHCVVFGVEPAAIDSVESFATVPAEEGESRSAIGHAYGFRCAFDVETDS